VLAATFKDLWARKLRLLTTGIAVCIGVAFMAGTMVLTDTITRTFDDLFASVNRGTDVQVRDRATADSEEFASRGRLDEALVAQVAAVDGVALAVGEVFGYAQVVGRDGEPIGDPGRGAPTFGGSWTGDDDLNPFHVVEGRAPQQEDEVVVDAKTAKEGNLTVGSTIRVIGQRPIPPVELTGIVRFGSADSPAGASFAGFTLRAAQQYIGEEGKVDSISVKARPGVSQDELRDRIIDALPRTVEVRTGAQVTEDDQSSIRQGLSFFGTFMLTFALIALFVGSFIIYNTFSILVAQRSRELALLRALGASRRQVVASVLIEAVLAGLAASAAGVVAGIGVARLLKGLLAALGFDLPAGGTVLTPRTVIVSLLTGVVVTTVAALLPARRASRIPPVAAMRDVVEDTGVGLLRRLLIGGVVAGLGTVLGAVGIFAASSAPMVGVGGVVLFIGIAILGPVIARPVAGLLGRPLPALRGVPGELARENAVRNPRRTSATASALMIGVALVGFITVFAASAKAALREVVSEQFAADLVVQSGTFGFGGIEPSVAPRIAALPEVAAASGLRIGAGKVGGNDAAVAGVDPAQYPQVVDLEVSDGRIEDLGRDGIAVLDDIARREGWEVGSSVRAEFAEGGPQELRVAAVYGRDEFGPDYLIGTETFDASFANVFDTEIYVKKADAASTAAAKAAIRRVLADEGLGGLDVVDRDEYVDAQAGDVDQLLSLIYALLLLAVIIAVMGIANTLALSIHERTHELGLLRAVGMTRRQLRSAVRWEAVIIAVLGTLLGLVIGVAFAAAMVGALADEGFDTLVVPGGQLLVITLIAALCGVVAAIRPARRAARLDVLQAIATT
jgi:putative ABC transport system permease protein